MRLKWTLEYVTHTPITANKCRMIFCPLLRFDFRSYIFRVNLLIIVKLTLIRSSGNLEK